MRRSFLVIVDFKITVFDFPLFYMRQGEAQDALRKALVDLGETLLDVEEINTGIPIRYKLQQNYPNPFNPNTQIRFDVWASGMTCLKVFDMLGREVATVVNEDLKPGSYKVTFDAGNLASGTYFYKITSGSFVDTKKMLLLR